MLVGEKLQEAISNNEYYIQNSTRLTRKKKSPVNIHC